MPDITSCSRDSRETLKYGTFGRKKFGFRAMSRRILKLCVASLLNILCFPAVMDISISRLRKVLPIFAESFDQTLILTFLMTIQCTIGCSRCLEKLFHRISLISRIFPPLYLRLSEYFLNIYDMYPPGTQSKLWHFYPRANSNPLQNFLEKIQIGDLIVVDGKAIPSQFF